MPPSKLRRAPILCIREKSSEGGGGGGVARVLFLLLDVAAGLALEAGAADDGDVGAHLLKETEQRDTLKERKCLKGLVGIPHQPQKALLAHIAPKR